MSNSNKGDNREITKLEFILRMLLGDMWGIAWLITGLQFWFFGWLTPFWELLLRWGHGSRYISTLRLIISFFVMNATIMFWSIVILLFSPETHEMRGAFLLIVNPLYISLAIFHRVAANRRLCQGSIEGVEQGNSNFFGYSYLFKFGSRLKWLQNPRFVYRWAEPGLCLLLAYGIYKIDPATGIWAFICTAGMFIYNNITIRGMAYQIQDVIDAQTEGEYVVSHVGEPVQSTKIDGFIVQSPVMNVQTEKPPWYKPPIKEPVVEQEDNRYGTRL